jgi:uncharacterized protein
MAEDPAPIDLRALDRYLCSDRSPANCMGLSELDGFLTAIVIGPEPIAESEWLPAIWHADEPDFASAAEMRRILGTIRGRHNQIATCLGSDPDSFAPIFRESPRGETIASDWAAGFIAAVNLRQAAWDPLIRHLRARIMLAPILFLGDGSRLAEEDGTPVDWAWIARRSPQTVPVCVSGIHDFWLDYRDRQRPRARLRLRRGRPSRR